MKKNHPRTMNCISYIRKNYQHTNVYADKKLFLCEFTNSLNYNEEKSYIKPWTVYSIQEKITILAIFIEHCHFQKHTVYHCFINLNKQEKHS